MSDTPYSIKLKGKKEVARDTMAFYFEKPTEFTYQAGQSADFTLIDPPETDPEGNTRAFSLASSPHEADLMIATRLRDTAFKRTLQNLTTGSTLHMAGPFGSFLLPTNPSTPVAYLIGGIGITPVRSMVIEATHKQKPNPITLFYSNRTPNDAPFMDELKALKEQNPFFTFVPTMTEVGDTAPWEGKTGYITTQLIQEYIPDPLVPIYYLCGPATMVTAMQKLLDELGVYNENIRTEEFTGY